MPMPSSDGSVRGLLDKYEERRRENSMITMTMTIPVSSFESVWTRYRLARSHGVCLHEMPYTCCVHNKKEERQNRTPIQIPEMM